MLPDTSAGPPPPPRREPAFNLPTVVLVTGALLFAIHAFLGFLDPQASFDAVLQFGFVPAVWTIGLDEEAVRVVAERLVATGAGDIARDLAFARYVLATASDAPWTLVTYAFLHGSWLHVGLNVVWLAAFGSPVARRIGTVRFLALALVCAVAGALAHWWSHFYELVPMIGASAAVSGMMAAAARFAFTPSGGLGFSSRPAHLMPRLSLVQMLANRSAMVFIGIWFAINLVFGVAATPLGLVDGGIAWEAHIGGFLAGLFLFPLVDSGPSRRDDRANPFA